MWTLILLAFFLPVYPGFFLIFSLHSTLHLLPFLSLLDIFCSGGGPLYSVVLPENFKSVLSGLGTSPVSVVS